MCMYKYNEYTTYIPYTAHYTYTSTSMLLFCPLCGGLLLINNEADSSSFTCKACVYTFPIKEKSYSARVELTRKKVDDVLGGEDAWKNVDSTEGKIFISLYFYPYHSIYLSIITFTFITLILLSYQSLALNAKILALTLCKFKSDRQTNPPQSFTNAAIIHVDISGERAKRFNYLNKLLPFIDKFSFICWLFFN